MIYLLILILAIQIAQLFIIFKGPKKIKESIISSKESIKFVQNDKIIKEVKREVLCPICSKPVTTRFIKRRDGLLGCELCSAHEAA